MCLTAERRGILERLLRSDQNSRRAADGLMACSAPAAEQVRAFAYSYMAEKFLSDRPLQDQDSLYDLGQAGYVKLRRMQAEGRLGDEWNTGCTGASSAMVRKALFFMALQRDISRRMEPDEIERAETVGDVAALCVKYCCKGEDDGH